MWVLQVEKYDRNITLNIKYILLMLKHFNFKNERQSCSNDINVLFSVACFANLLFLLRNNFAIWYNVLVIFFIADHILRTSNSDTKQQLLYIVPITVASIHDEERKADITEIWHNRRNVEQPKNEYCRD